MVLAGCARRVPGLLLSVLRRGRLPAFAAVAVPITWRDRLAAVWYRGCGRSVEVGRIYTCGTLRWDYWRLEGLARVVGSDPWWT